MWDLPDCFGERPAGMRLVGQQDKDMTERLDFGIGVM